MYLFFKALLSPLDFRSVRFDDSDRDVVDQQLAYTRALERACIGVYVADENSIFFIPYNTERADDLWHFFDTHSGAIRAYRPFGAAATDDTFKSNPSKYAFNGGIYSPHKRRIYLIPYNQVLSGEWYYIDLLTRRIDVVAGPPVVEVKAYCDAVYCPYSMRIYLVPYNQARESYWHYIDCRSGQVVAYNAISEALATQGAYQGGVYCPIRKRIYFVPYMQANKAHWHYVDCQNGVVVAYEHGLRLGNSSTSSISYEAYHGGVYSPSQRRIYLVPYRQARYAEWHYIDCESGRVVAYENVYSCDDLSVSAEAYRNGVFAPESNRIYLAPFKQAYREEWHYIDCNTGRVIAYQHGSYQVKTVFQKAIHVPKTKKVILLPNDACQYNMLSINSKTASVTQTLLQRWLA